MLLVILISVSPARNSLSSAEIDLSCRPDGSACVVIAAEAEEEELMDSTADSRFPLLIFRKPIACRSSRAAYHQHQGAQAISLAAVGTYLEHKKQGRRRE
jgi:hypothetical protein